MQQILNSDRLLDRTPVFLLAENTVSPVLPAANPFARNRSSRGSGGGEVIVSLNRMTERMAREDLKWYLMNRYRTIIVDKMTPGDFEELRHYHRRQYDPKSGWDDKYVKKFVMKLREYINEEVLKHEIAGIDTMMTLIKPEDLQKKRDDMTPQHAGADPVANIPLKTLVR